MTETDGVYVHGTAVALGPWGVLLRGGSGAGKSDLALRLIERGAKLISDDQVHLFLEGGLVYGAAPQTISGLLEVRGIGVVPMPVKDKAPIVLLLDLVPHEDVPRLPDAESETHFGLDLPVLKLFPFESSAPEKVKVALRSLLGEDSEPEPNEPNNLSVIYP